MKKVIITGGTGSIGQKLKLILVEKGYEVIILTSNKSKEDATTFFCDIQNQKIDLSILKNTFALIHLAGANIAEKRWTTARKEELTTSRIDNLSFLHQKFKEINEFPEVLVSSSATGFYGAFTVDKIFEETDENGNDFIGNLCKKWENAALLFKQINSRVVILRTGVVLSNQKNGMLQKILPIFKLGLGSAIGNGNQFFPWIHIDDIANAYAFALENNQLEGVFNGVSPEFITNNNFSKNLALVLKKPFIFPAVSKFVLKLVFGELECILTEGSKISAKKLINAGFNFKFTNSKESLKNILEAN